MSETRSSKVFGLDNSLSAEDSLRFVAPMPEQVGAPTMLFPDVSEIAQIFWTFRGGGKEIVNIYNFGLGAVDF